MDYAFSGFFSSGETLRTGEVLDTLRLLICQSEVVPELRFVRGPKESFELVQQITKPFYYEQPLQQRVELAISIAVYDSGAELFRIALGRGRIPSSAINMTDTLGESLLHGVADSIGYTQFYSTLSDNSEADFANLRGDRLS